MSGYLIKIYSLKMRVLSSLFWASITLFISGCSSDIGVSDVQFGTFSVGASSVTFRAESSLSRESQPIFGWAFSMKNPPQKFIIREVVEGPAGTIWESPPNSPEVQVTDGGRTALVTRTISRPNSPFIFHHWSISSSDPIGKYKAILYIDGEVIRHVDFEVAN
ncbi:MAG: hypothetical protein PHP57_07680 [Sideroxydans sp.]|nr:hypothetical protein [Sideroxydans sp.]